MKKLIIDKSDRLYRLRPDIHFNSAPMTTKFKEKKLPLIDHYRKEQDFPFTNKEKLCLNGGTIQELLIKINSLFREYYQSIFSVSLEDPIDIIVFPRKTEAIQSLFFSYLDPEDGIIITDPGHPIYRNMAMLTDAQIIKIPALPRFGFLPNLGFLDNNYHLSSRMLCLNYPHIPTGAALDDFYIKELLKVSKKYNLLIFNDQSLSLYRHEEYAPCSAFGLDNKTGRFIELFSFYLPFYDFAPTFLVGHKEILRHIKTYNNQFGYDHDHFSLNMVLEWLKEYQNMRDKAADRIKKNYFYSIEFLKEWNWYFHKPSAGHLLWVKCPPGYSSDGLALSLLRTANIRIIPGTYYGEYGEGYFVLNLNLNEEEIIGTFERIKKFGFPLKISKLRQ